MSNETQSTNAQYQSFTAVGDHYREMQRRYDLHDELVAALEKIETIGNWSDENSHLGRVCKIARTSLAKAKGASHE